MRRIFRLSLHSPHFRRVVQLPAFTGPLRALWGDDIKCLQSMALLKPPGTGEKFYHADQGPPCPARADGSSNLVVDLEEELGRLVGDCRGGVRRRAARGP